MDGNYISSPKEFQHTEGVESIDFQRTFALDGMGNDEALRLYLRKAGLSDEIEYLTPKQRRAFIYDIIRSNKMPGYWRPSTLVLPPSPDNSTKTIIPNTTPTPPERSTTTTLTPVMKRHGNTVPPMVLNYATMSTSSSSSSLQSLAGKKSPLLPRRVEPAPTTPPLLTTLVTSKRGSKYEISGPVNFQHMAGDVTRDRTHNAFDLSLTTNDNVLRKYIIERGIREEDLRGMRKQDIIKNIVQSKFTWMPPKPPVVAMGNDRNSTYMLYSTSQPSTPRVSRSRTSKVPPPPPPRAPFLRKEGNLSSSASVPVSPSPSSTTSLATSQCSLNFLSSRFADPSDFPSIEDIYSSKIELKSPSTQSTGTHRKQVPQPPVYSEEVVFDIDPAPASFAQVGSHNVSPVLNHFNQSLENLDKFEFFEEGANESSYERVVIERAEALKKPAPIDDNIYSTIKSKNAMAREKVNTSKNSLYATVDDKRKMVKTIPPKPPLKSKLLINAVPNSSPPPPPPLPPTVMNETTASTITAAGSATPPAPPPPPPLPLLDTSTKKKNEQSVIPVEDSDDGRDALLYSIRKGVTLKNIDQKAVTISAIKTRTERKPPINDFLTELKMGVTLRRVKHKKDNPYAGEEPDESQA